MKHQVVTALLVVCAWNVNEARACADDRGEGGALSGIELSAGIGVMGHNTTGVGEPLLGYGYDHEPGPVADGKLRLIFGHHRFFRHGMTFRGGFNSGRQFGRNGYGFRHSFGEVGYTIRSLFPCMSNDDTKIYGGATLGFTGAFADAGVGRGAMGDDENVRRMASEDLDHRAWGWVLGGEIQIQHHSFLIGLDIDMRRLYGIDTVAERTMLGSAVLRVGMAFDWSRSTREYAY